MLKSRFGWPTRRPLATMAQRHMAFLSYSHRDEAMADWLHRELETYRVPAALVGRLTDRGPIPARLSPIFRDRHELAASGDLGATIEEAIAGSRFLIVLCSPDAAASRWTNAEIACFKKHHGEARVLAAIVAGEPFASDMPGREAEECFPPALRERYDKRGRATGRRAEPIAADLRDHGDGREAGLQKLIAGMLGIGLDDLVQREARRNRRRTNLVVGASLAGTLVASSLAVVAIQARDSARDERRAAEGLVGFMIGDLRQKLEPIGRLDILDSVGERALAYYAGQDRRALSDDSLAQRAKALTLMGEVAFNRGQLDQAYRLYRESDQSTRELLIRDPTNAERLFGHAQNVFWVGYVLWQRGERDRAAANFREYRALADRMIAADPAKPEYQLERIYADTNLGTVSMEQRRFAEAGAAYQATLGEIEALVRTDPRNSQYQDMRLEALAWLSDARHSEGRLDEAIALRRQELALLGPLVGAAADTRRRKQEMVARSALSRLLSMRGDLAGALAEARRAVDIGQFLLQRDGTNADWLRATAAARLELGETALSAGDRATASASIAAGCQAIDQLVARDPTVLDWRGTMRSACLRAQARQALAAGRPADALAAAQQGVAAARAVEKSDSAILLASQAEAMLGEALAASGQPAAARGAWTRALAGWPDAADWRPREVALRAVLLRRSGRAAEARPLTERLAAMGYVQPDYLKGIR